MWLTSELLQVNNQIQITWKINWHISCYSRTFAILSNFKTLSFVQRLWVRKCTYAQPLWLRKHSYIRVCVCAQPLWLNDLTHGLTFVTLKLIYDSTNVALNHNNDFPPSLTFVAWRWKNSYKITIKNHHT